VQIFGKRVCNPCQQPILDRTGMDYCPQKNEEKDQGEQCPASYFTGFFQMGILDRLKVQKACCIFKPREPF